MQKYIKYLTVGWRLVTHTLTWFESAKADGTITADEAIELVEQLIELSGYGDELSIDVGPRPGDAA